MPSLWAIYFLVYIISGVLLIYFGLSPNPASFLSAIISFLVIWVVIGEMKSNSKDDFIPYLFLLFVSIFVIAVSGILYLLSPGV